jgi:glycosyltransferase involved in cell wall biosynthesis
MSPTDNKKIRIAYLINHFGKGGGTENQLATLIRNIDRDRFIPHLIVLIPLWEETDLNLDCEVIFLDITSFLSFKFPLGFCRLVGLLRRLRIDILQMFFFDARILGVLAGKLAGVKKIVACRRDCRYNLDHWRLKMYRFLGRFVDYMLVNAHRVREMVTETEKFSHDRITVIHNGIQLESSRGNDPLAEHGLILNRSRPVVGMVANLRPVKRIDRFLEVAAKLNSRNVQLILIGWGRDPEKYKQMAKDLGIYDRFFMEHINHDVDQIIKKFDVALLTSQSEGLSNSLIEYCLCEIPTVAFNIGGNAEILDDGVTGYIVPDGDIAAMTEKVDYLLENPNFATEMGRKSAARAREMFSISKMVKSTEEFYEMIIQSDNRKAPSRSEDANVSR